MVRKSKGFSWGAAGVSTALFTGVAMSALISKARPRKEARYVCLEGADKLVWWNCTQLPCEVWLLTFLDSPTDSTGLRSSSIGSWTLIEA